MNKIQPTLHEPVDFASFCVHVNIVPRVLSEGAGKITMPHDNNSIEAYARSQCHIYIPYSYKNLVNNRCSITDEANKQKKTNNVSIIKI